MKMINEFVDGERIYGQFLIAECNKCVSNKSKTYLNMTLQDKSGTISAKLWDVIDSDLELFIAGNIVELQGDVLEYAGQLQFKIEPGCARQIIPNVGFDFSRFVPSAPVAKEELETKFKNYIDSIKNEDIKKLVVYLTDKFASKFFEWPAAVRNHHNFVNGLLYHTVTMADVADAVCKQYTNLNRDILLGGILIHDIGKCEELSGPIATQFTIQGKLVGHISIAHGEVREACHKLNLDPEISAIMEHMILSHHGKNEFGSPVTPCIKEAFVCAMIDDLDAKMNILDKALAVTKPGDTTAKLFNMDDRYFYKPTFED